MNIKAGGGGNRKTCRVTEVAGNRIQQHTVFIYHEAVGKIAVGCCCCDLWSQVGHR